MKIEFDICANRHKNNPQSELAFKKVKLQKDRNTILDFLDKNNTGHSKQLARFMGKPLNCISGRISDLKKDGLIEPVIDEDGNRVTLEGCQVYRKTFKLF